MKKPIFENDQEAREFIFDMYDRKYSVDEKTIKRIKQKGYIKKSVVEEAEEMYYRWSKENKCELEVMTDLIHKEFEAIQELKQKIKYLETK